MSVSPSLSISVNELLSLFIGVSVLGVQRTRGRLPPGTSMLASRRRDHCTMRLHGNWTGTRVSWETTPAHARLHQTHGTGSRSEANRDDW